ncbi:hypothetical protein H9639_15155 [Arthrobacter sp. Sa2CUA1]|uniref:Uncharacterized protein n=1 Tax=Arthrobacter gallicola TaxID=2762225 RepID=A0ABR8UVQ0_9MICC|nr:hypothetical protein [Arthrobacter gallicola]MBD7996635.1 hypothetical protein [Arthrobacter gallicola]
MAALLPWVRNRFWLVLVALLLNAALTPLLPPAYLPESFNEGIPAALLVSEVLLRTVVVVLPVLMPLPAPRLALAVYTAGVLLYAGAWAAVIWAPASTWSTSLIGFTAPAWVPLVWLCGVGLGSTLRFVSGYRPWMYLAAAAAFTAVHTAHTALAWTLATA